MMMSQIVICLQINASTYSIYTIVSDGATNLFLNDHLFAWKRCHLYCIVLYIYAQGQSILIFHFAHGGWMIIIMIVGHR